MAIQKEDTSTQNLLQGEKDLLKTALSVYAQTIRRAIAAEPNQKIKALREETLNDIKNLEWKL